MELSYVKWSSLFGNMLRKYTYMTWSSLFENIIKKIFIHENIEENTPMALVT
jgi:hypothetical protein